jgi:hypothetical protein
MDTNHALTHQPCEADGAHDSDGHANGCQPHTTREDKHQHVAPLRAERHTDTHLLRALRHQRRHHAVNAHAGKQQRQRGKRSEQDHGKPLRGHGVRFDAAHRLLAAENLLAAHLLVRGAKRFQNSLERAVIAQHRPN